MKKQKIVKKRSLISLLLGILLVLAVWQWDWTVYYYQQAKGGLNIAFNTRPLAEVLQDTSVADSLKARIRLIADIRRFALDSLRLQDNPKVYQTLFDQQGKPLVYLLTVAEPYEMKGIDFSFPIIGTFTYKGFFDSTRAWQEEAQWKKRGYDTDMGEGIAYSTLGWLPEPILSNMLFYSEGKLASLIIHEMTHGTIFVKDDHETSENLANFIGDYGAERYLQAKYGTQSKQYLHYTQGKKIREPLVKFMNKSTLQLDSLYKTFRPSHSKTYKEASKQAFIKKIMYQRQALIRQLRGDTTAPKPILAFPNNAYFIGFKTYHAKQNQFEQLFYQQFRGDYKRFFVYLKAKYQ